MTALDKYQRLEVSGLWRPIPGTQRREVVVSIGDASLMLSDPRTGQALSHWSLAAVVRYNPGEVPALFGPTVDQTGESLELDAPEMIEALETVHTALERRRPHRGSLRAGVVAATLAAIVALGVFWLPGAVRNHTASVLPMIGRVEVGKMIATGMERYTGAHCTDPEAQALLDALATRLFGEVGARVVVLRDGPRLSLHLPGRHLLVHRRVIEQHDGPEVLAGVLLAERLRAEAQDPLLPVLDAAGLRGTLTLLTTGAISEDMLDPRAQAQNALAAPQAEVPDEPLLRRFAEARVPSTPYALMRDPTGQQTLGLIEADPVPAAEARPLMPDSGWLVLQGICGR